MSGAIVLTLDTTAPRLTWGAVDGAVASEILTVFYSINEPGVQSAQIELLDGRVLAMMVEGDRLTVALPADAPEGNATVTANLRDAVWNASTATLAVAISGTLIPTPTVPVGQPASPTRASGRLIRSEPSRAATSSAYEQTAVVSSTSQAVARTRYTAPSRENLGWISVLSSSSTGYVTAAVSTTETRKLASRSTITKRPEGPDAEAELIALGLL